MLCNLGNRGEGLVEEPPLQGGLFLLCYYVRRLDLNLPSLENIAVTKLGTTCGGLIL